MLEKTGKWFKIYEDEIQLFIWSVLLLFFIRCACIIFNNFSETAFLKRYGIEYLPIVYMVNSLLTFAIMGSLAAPMKRLPGTKLLAYLLFLFGLIVAGLRFLVPLGFDFLYPVLFVMNTQFEVLLILIFWNMGNDLFNTRQSKRIFPLITAGGVIGRIIGSFGTPFLVKTISFDNLMFVYFGFTLAGALIAWRMGVQYPTLLISRKREPAVTRKRSSLIREFRQMIPMIKTSTLLKIFILLTLLPNLVIPILNYQFNFAVNQTFASEGGLVQFFGYFRGVTNIISLVILLFIGRVYGRFGLPVILMFHPFNYFLVFTAFFFQLNLFSAIYARLSTNIIRTTMNQPAIGILMGLFPQSRRNSIRPFLRGTVVRVGTLTGSAIILFTQDILHPRYLSAIALVCVCGWIATTLFLKKNYSKILLDLISKNILDLKSMENHDIAQLFKDKSAGVQLEEQFLKAKGEDVLWYARLLKAQKHDGLDGLILSVVEKQTDPVKVRLIHHLTPDAGEEAIAKARQIADFSNRDLMMAVIAMVGRLPQNLSRSFHKEVFNKAADPVVKAHAVVALYQDDPDTYKPVIDSWLYSQDAKKKEAGVIAAGHTGDKSYVRELISLLEGGGGNGKNLSHILTGLHRLRVDNLNTILEPFLIHQEDFLRRTALKLFKINDDHDMKQVIIRMNDKTKRIEKLAQEKLLNAGYQNPLLLVEALTMNQRKIRRGVFILLEYLNIKELEVYRYAKSQIRKGYGLLAEKNALAPLPESPEKQLLLEHLDQKKLVRMENILRVLAAQDESGRMRIVWHGIFSADPRERSNSIEALEELTDPALSRLMVPLLEDLSMDENLALGKKKFDLPDPGPSQADSMAYFLKKRDWIAVILALAIVEKGKIDGIDRSILTKLTQSDNIHIQQLANRVLA